MNSTTAKPSEVTKIHSIQSGVAGEYFVAGELARRGIVASITLRNSRGVDILACQPGAESRTISIQVKTNQGNNNDWQLSSEAETNQSPTHFFVFVSLGAAGARPRYFIFPSAVVAKNISDGHRSYMATPKKDGTPKAESTHRRFFIRMGDPGAGEKGENEDAWEILWKRFA